MFTRVYGHFMNTPLLRQSKVQIKPNGGAAGAVTTFYCSFFNMLLTLLALGILNYTVFLYFFTFQHSLDCFIYVIRLTLHFFLNPFQPLFLLY
jgi:hypothetical protein